MTVRTVTPIRDVSKFVFLVSDPTIVNSLVGWSKETVPVSTEMELDEQAAETYKLQQKHSLYGGCLGSLVVGSTRMSHESIDSIGHSRQWDLTNIKELKRTPPYEIEVRPFTGNDYEFELLQKGMSSRDYQLLAEKTKKQRAPQCPPPHESLGGRRRDAFQHWPTGKSKQELQLNVVSAYYRKLKFPTQERRRTYAESGR